MNRAADLKFPAKAWRVSGMARARPMRLRAGAMTAGPCLCPLARFRSGNASRSGSDSAAEADGRKTRPGALSPPVARPIMQDFPDCRRTGADRPPRPKESAGCRRPGRYTLPRASPPFPTAAGRGCRQAGRRAGRQGRGRGGGSSPERRAPRWPARASAWIAPAKSIPAAIRLAILSRRPGPAWPVPPAPPCKAIRGTVQPAIGQGRRCGRPSPPASADGRQGRHPRIAWPRQLPAGMGALRRGKAA